MTILYRWTGINVHGQKTNGVLYADNKTTALVQLQRMNITVLSIKNNSYKNYWHQKNKFTQKQRLDFTQQLALLLQSGAPLADALQLIAVTSPTNNMRYIANAIKEKIIEGQTLSAALDAFPQYFNHTYCQLITAGEQTGELDAVLEQLITDQTQSLQMKHKITKALYYPISVCIVTCLITIGLLIFVIPQFRAIYASFGAQLPAMTQLLIHISQILLKSGWYYVGSISMLSWIMIKIWKRNLVLRNTMHYLLLKIPLLKSLLITQQMAQWTQVFSTTLSAGIPLVQALKITNNTLTHPLFKAQMEKITESVITGKTLHHALAEKSPLFPLRARHLIAIGENADSLEQIMQKLKLSYQIQCKTTFDHLSKLLEPVMMVVVASFVAGLIIALYLPIFRMGSVI